MNSYPTRALRMQHADDPAAEITKKTNALIKELSLVNPYEVLVAIYQRPEKTTGGVFLTERARGEDVWQGKVGLVLALGELAFSADSDRKWPKVTPTIGDWVVFRTSDSWQFLLGDQHCRVVPDTHVRFIISEPDIVY